MNLKYPRTEITGTILAGGQARRMGGRDKGLIELGGVPLIAHVLEAIRPQVGPILINANRNRDRYAAFGVPVIGDDGPGHLGPLAGVASAMRAAATPLIATLPCDSPCPPPDLVERLQRALADRDADIAYAHDGTRAQPVFALLRCKLLVSVQDYLQQGHRKIDGWYARHRAIAVDFSACPETFLNLNRPEDLALLEERLHTLHAAPT